jgi:proteasome alpha subunit
MFGPNASMGYDRSSTMYSPDGRIIQTEYAREAMRRGSISVAIRSAAGVVLAGQTRVSDLDLPNSKIAQVDDHFAAIFAGFAADGRVLINRARVEAQIHKITYSEPADIKHIANRLADYAHMFTQQGGLRPLGIGLLLGGIDYDGLPKIYFVNPGGGLWETKGKAVGAGDSKAMQYLMSNYKEELNMEELITLARDTIKHASGTTDEKEIEVWSIEAKPESIPKYEDVY